MLASLSKCSCRLPGLLLAVVSALGLYGAPSVSAQTTYFWRNEASNGNWNTSGNWYNQDTNQSSGVPSGNENINFNNNAQLTMTNDLGNTSRYRINFLNGSGARTIGGSTANSFFDFGGNIPQIYNNSGNTQTINFGIIDANGNNSGRLQLNADSTSNSKAGSNLVFGGSVSASGGARTIALTGSGDISITGQVTQAAGATLALSMEGTGTLAISNSTNNYTGGTSVSSGGTLLVNGNNAAATGAVSISGTLGGSNGTVGGAVTINSGGRITGGTAGTVGALTLSNNLAVNGTLLADISGATSDLLTLGINSLTLGSGSTLTISGSLDGLSTYTLATYGSRTGTFGTVNNLPANYAVSYGVATLNLVPVPEPATWMGGAALVGVALWGGRRRLRKAA